ncbi:hypothetical protein FGADI_4979 [Fusarium gaditjirri]|uniref:RING-type domain-containing protein n=1 Tax=Fusarium gaditjirri TaxID=282569 RepID=A0A8H4TBG9_9HYPO|nr:hypothetical protein FGADI_4979 [Fusarium gaditjirri]
MCIMENPADRPWFIIPNDVPHVTEDSQNGYWPNIEASIDNNEFQFKDLSIECVVCRTDVTVFPKDHVVDEEVGESHRAVILPCGHIFGASCVKRFFDMKNEEGARASCIKCRAACYHPACGHPFYGEPMPSHVPGMAFTPHVVGKGGKIDMHCEKCTYKKAIYDIMAEVQGAPDATEAMKKSLVVILTAKDKSYVLRPVETSRLQRVYFPASVVDRFVEYMDRTEKDEAGQGYWISGRLTGCNVRLYVLEPEN